MPSWHFGFEVDASCLALERYRGRSPGLLDTNLLNIL